MSPDVNPRRSEESQLSNSDSSHDSDSSTANSMRIEPADDETARPEPIFRSTSRMSGPDAFEPQSVGPEIAGVTTGKSKISRADSYREVGDEVYERLSSRRKVIVVAVLSFCSFLSPMSSTTVLAAVPEVAAEYDTTGSIINISNAAYMVFMALSPIVWGPVSHVFGRWPITLLTAVAFFALSLGTALAPNLAAFFVFRALSAFEGTAFILLGAASIGDIYRPVERGTAMGWFMSGSLIGPAFGPFIGGVIVTYSSWRTIFWLQAALAGAGALAIFFLVPETIHYKMIEDLKGQSHAQKARAVLSMINPIKVLKLYRYKALVLSSAGSSGLVWNMYSLLTPIRYVLNPRFNLETPLLGGLFYLAPGCGYLLGTFGGGRWADWTVKRWIRKRGGVRVPEDRLRAAIPFMGGLIPACILVYGWTVDQAVGGIPVPVIVLFLQGVGQLFCFPALNTYCLDVMPGHGAEVAAANFFMRYMAGCVGTAVVLPIVEAIGVGWFSTISTGILIATTVGTMAAIKWGKEWRDEIDAKEKQSRKKKERKEAKKKAEKMMEEGKSMDEDEGADNRDDERNQPVPTDNSPAQQKEEK